MERITAKYYIETPFAVEKAAQVLAGEQSSGTFVAVPGETEELKKRFAARIEKITQLESVNEPAIPGAKAKEGLYHRANIEVSWSIENFGYNLPVLISTLQGNLYELTQFTGLKLMDIELPASYASHFEGARFGIEGSRLSTGVNNRPLIGTIIKPSIGMTPEQTAELVKKLVEADIDFIKDDELISSAANSVFEDDDKPNPLRNSCSRDSGCAQYLNSGTVERVGLEIASSGSAVMKSRKDRLRRPR